MKKLTALILCLLLSVSFISCTLLSDDPDKKEASEQTPTAYGGGSSSASSEKSEPTEAELAAQAYEAVLNNEIPLVYETGEEEYLRDVIGWSRTFSPQKAMVDMDEDGMDEIVISAYPNFSGTKYILHYENGIVYGFSLNSEYILYDDGSFYWYDYTLVSESGYSRLSFFEGNVKYEEICRQEYGRYYLFGLEVTSEEYEEYFYQHPRPQITFEPLDISSWKVAIAIELAEHYWGITDGSFDEKTGYRYRIIASSTSSENKYYVCLYWFVKNTYYENIRCVLVDVDSGEVEVSSGSHRGHSDGKG